MQQTATSVSDDSLYSVFIMLFTLHFCVPSMTFTCWPLQVDISQSDTRYETVLPLRVRCDGGGNTQAEADATTTSAAQEGGESARGADSTVFSGERQPISSAPSLPPPRSMDTNPVYTEAVIVSGSRTVHPSATEVVVYDDIKAFKNKDVQCIQIIRPFGHSFHFLGSAICHTA